MVKDHAEVDVFLGVDVGKGNTTPWPWTGPGTRVFDKVLPNDEATMKAVLDKLTAHGTVLFVVDQPATIGALPVAVAQSAGIAVGYLPGLAMRFDRGPAPG